MGSGVVTVGVGVLAIGVGVGARLVNSMRSRLWYPPVETRRTHRPLGSVTRFVTSAYTSHPPVFGTTTVVPASVPSTASLNEVPVRGLATVNVTS